MAKISEKNYYTIGQVVEKLKTDFSGVTISKVRFLEEEGLIKPERTAGGYRKFSDTDIKRLKAILKLQQEQFLPLSVIKRNKKLIDKGLKGSTAKINGSDGLGLKEVKEISLKEAIRKLRLTKKQLDELKKYSIVDLGGANNGQKMINDLDFEILGITKSLAKYGIEPRHLRTYENFIENEAMLIYQIAAPYIKNKRRFEEKVSDLTGSLQNLKKALLKRSLFELFKDRVPGKKS